MRSLHKGEATETLRNVLQGKVRSDGRSLGAVVAMGWGTWRRLSKLHVLQSSRLCCCFSAIQSEFPFPCPFLAVPMAARGPSRGTAGVWAPRE